MKFWKHSLIAACTFLSLATVVTYTSCVQDSCKALKCRNGGTCADEFCRCPVGWEGTQCENATRNKFTGRYDGITQVNGEPSFQDSALVDNLPFSTTGVRINIFSRTNSHEFIGNVNETDAFEVVDNGKTLLFTRIGNERIEISIEETVDGKKSITNFQGTRRPRN